jgi:hydrogenase small subunit
MRSRDDTFRMELENRGVTRRDFVGFCAGMATMLGLSSSAAAKIAAALETKAKPTIVWLEFQDCCGNTESFLRASKPSAADVILDLLSVDYHETIMAAAGSRATAALDAAAKKGGYIVVIEGSIPTGANGAYCTIGGKSAMQIADEVCKNALAVVAVGTCAAFGGIPAAAPNPTSAKSVEEAVSGIGTLINLPACPVNAENLTALLVHFMTFGAWPALDDLRRPKFAYGKLIHDACERRAHFDAGQYVEQWGDEAHRAGACLFKMGCKGPATSQNCPNVGWNDHTNWPIGCGHPCIGCAEPNFWDRMTPFYQHLKGIPGFNAATSVDTIGAVATAGVAGAFTAHGLVQLTRKVKGHNGVAPTHAIAMASKPPDPAPASEPTPEPKVEPKKEGES